MSDDQWTVAGLLIALFAIEAALNKNVRTWLVGILGTISAAVTRTDNVTSWQTKPGGPVAK